MVAQTLTIKGENFVVIPEREYRRLTLRDETSMPPMPAPDKDGDYPARQTVRLLTARKLIALRRAAGLSQAELARRAGIRVETLNRLEKGKHAANSATLMKIERAMG